MTGLADSQAKNDAQDEKFGERLKSIRTVMHLSQKQMAKEIGVSSRSYQRMENGDIEVFKISVLKKYDCFGVDLNWLITGRSIPMAEIWPLTEVDSLTAEQIMQRIDSIEKGTQYQLDNLKKRIKKALGSRATP